MARESSSRVALLSIQPRYAEKILAGTKTVEFRKRGFGSPVEHVVVYSSSPTQLVLGFFQVGGVLLDHPRRLWSSVGSQGGITKREFDDYYRGRSVGAAIVVGELWRLRKPVPLSKLGVPRVTAPQSYRYLPESSMKRLRGLAERATADRRGDTGDVTRRST